MQSNQFTIHTLRLMPGHDLVDELADYVNKNDIHAAFIITCVGSLTKAVIRMAYSGKEHNQVNEYNEHHEIVSLVGTLSNRDASHLHISISDKNGLVKGGHVMSGCKVFTTAEVVIGCLNDLKYTRGYCEQSGYDELVVLRK